MNPWGPFEKLPDPLTVDTGNHSLSLQTWTAVLGGKNTVLGLGSLKFINPVYNWNGVFYALNNRVTVDSDNKTGSTIALIG